MTAQQVSRILREAGVPKASRYRVWGREVEGFIVMAPSRFIEGSPITVAITPKYDAGREMCVQIACALDAAGVPFTTPNRNGLGGDYRLTVAV
jgi:hypothetical protein